MKRYNLKGYNFLFMAIVCLTTVSCLKSGLEDLPAFDDANITGVYYEYRYTVVGPSGLPELKTQSFGSQSVSADNLNVDLVVTVPASGGTFTDAERAKVSINNLCVRINVSNAATVTPVDGAPMLGAPGNFSSPVKYRVTAADGTTSKVWTLNIQLVK